MPRQPSWTDQQLLDAVAASTCFKEVCDTLGLWPGGGRYRTLERHMGRLRVDGSHLAPATRRVAQSARQFRFVKAHVLTRGLDTSHFTGRSWAKGRTTPLRPRRELEEVISERSTYPTGKLRRRVLSACLLKAECARCGLNEWQGHPLMLELDHINGDHTDHRLENLRPLCPNCHAQTETYAGRRHRSV